MVEEATPRDKLEREVIRARKPLSILYVNEAGTDSEILIKAISADDLRNATELFTALIVHLIKVGANMQSIGARIAELTETSRSTGSGDVVAEGDSVPAPVEVSSETIDEIIAEAIKPEMVRDVLMQAEGAIKTIIEIGTNAKYEDISSDFLVVGEFVLKVIEHNTGPELMDFLSRGMKKILLLTSLKKEKKAVTNEAIEPSS